MGRSFPYRSISCHNHIFSCFNGVAEVGPVGARTESAGFLLYSSLSSQCPIYSTHLFDYRGVDGLVLHLSAGYYGCRSSKSPNIRGCYTYGWHHVCPTSKIYVLFSRCDSWFLVRIRINDVSFDEP